MRLVNLEVRSLVKKQMRKAITYCELKKAYCSYSTTNFCLTPRECEYNTYPGGVITFGRIRRKDESKKNNRI